MLKRIIVSIILMLILSVSVSALSAFIKDGSDNTVSLYYAGSSSDPSFYYKDAYGSNADSYLKLCDSGTVQNKYVGATYAINDTNAGAWKYVLISWKSATIPLVQVDTDAGSGCWTPSAAGLLSFSSSKLTGLTPEPHVAAFPGRLWALYSSSPNGASPDFVSLPSSNGYLRGYYSVSRTFSETTGNITIGTPTIYFTSSGSTFSKGAGVANFGVNSDRKMVIGVCQDIYGANCSAGEIISSSSQFPLSLNTSIPISPVLDSTTYTKYVVINGMDYSICIGPETDMVGSAVTLNPTSGSQGVLVNITASVTNNGDVTIGASKSFNVSFWKTSPSPVEYIGDLTITGGLTPSQSQSVTWLNYDTSHLVSSPTFKANLSDSTYAIGSCGGDKDDTATLSWITYVRPYVYIDGTLTDNLTCAGKPHNVTIQLNDTNGNILSDTWIYLNEVNGINPFATLQVYNASGGTRYVKSVSRVDVQTDSDGFVNFNIIPTGNKLLSDPAYAYLNLSNIVGNYELYFTTNNSNDILQNGVNSNQYNLTLQDLTLCSPNSTEQYTLSVLNQDNQTKTILNFVYQTFATARRWLTP